MEQELENIHELSKEVKDELRTFIVDLRRKEVRGSYDVAKRTACLMRKILHSWKWDTAGAALRLLHRVGAMLCAAQPGEVCVGNIVRRVIYYLRLEYNNLKELQLSHIETEEVKIRYTLQDLLTPEGEETYHLDFKDLKKNVLGCINDLLDELDNLYHDVASHSLEHIHTNEIIMTFGKSNTVFEFLKKAAQKVKFHVVVVESAPSLLGRVTAILLSEAGVDTTLIPDSAIFAMMSRVNKVIVSTQAVMADGSLVGLTGTHLLAQAAQHYSVPFVVCCGLYKLSPLYPSDPDMLTDMNSPGQILSYDEVDRISGSRQEGIDVQNPSYDVVPPGLISLFLTNHGAHSPSYIYRVLSECYNPEDCTLGVLPHGLPEDPEAAAAASS